LLSLLSITAVKAILVVYAAGVLSCGVETGESLMLHLFKEAYGRDVTASVVYWSEFLATDPEVLGSIPGASRFPEKQQVWIRSTQPREDN
jgi:hypothetical protein